MFLSVTGAISGFAGKFHVNDLKSSRPSHEGHKGHKGHHVIYVICDIYPKCSGFKDIKYDIPVYYEGYEGHLHMFVSRDIVISRTKYQERGFSISVYENSSITTSPLRLIYSPIPTSCPI